MSIKELTIEQLLNIEIETVEHGKALAQAILEEQHELHRQMVGLYDNEKWQALSNRHYDLRKIRHAILHLTGLMAIEQKRADKRQQSTNDFYVNKLPTIIYNQLMSNAELQTYTGEVVSGTGHMSARMSSGSVALDLYEKETGVKLIPGSLNVRLEHEVDMPPYAKQIVRCDHEGEAIIYITPALVNALDCFAVRNKLAEDGVGRHSKQVVEIISEHKLREELGLNDGDLVEVKF